MEWETGYKFSKANEMSSWTSHREEWEILLVAFVAICPQEEWTMSLWSWGLCSNIQRKWCCESTGCSSITVHPHVPASLFPTHSSLSQSYCPTHNILSLAPQACPFLRTYISWFSLSVFPCSLSLFGTDSLSFPDIPSPTHITWFTHPTLLAESVLALEKS